MNHLKYPYKMLLMGLVISLPLSFLMYMLISDVNIRLSSALDGKAGLKINRHVLKLLKNVQEHRGMTNAFLSDDLSFRETITIKKNHIEGNIQRIDIFTHKLAAKDETADKWDAIKIKWKNIDEKKLNLPHGAYFSLHTALTKEILAFMNQVVYKSGLTSGVHDIDYNLVDIAINRLPLAIEYADQVRGLGSGDNRS